MAMGSHRFLAASWRDFVKRWSFENEQSPILFRPLAHITAPPLWPVRMRRVTAWLAMGGDMAS
jgi:hypothetical protein